MSIPPSPSRAQLRQHTWLICAMAGYQWVLCFVSTNVMSMSSALVAVVEASILGCAAVMVLRRKGATTYCAFLAAVLCYFGVLMTFRGAIDPQDVRNILIPLTFFFLGAEAPDRKALDRIFWVLACFVLVGVVLEYGATDLYLRYFNIQHYYADRGVVKGALDYINKNVLFNGVRFTGRNILPFLGNQRISSIFLEPVSMGNFAVLVAAWGLSFPRKERRLGYRHLAMSALFIIAADSRFASLMVGGLILVRMVPLLRHRAALLALPPFAVVVLLAAYSFAPEAGVGDTMLGRVVRSGEALALMDVSQWFGVGQTEAPGDMGVAYTVEHLGLLLAIVLAACLTLLRFERGQPANFRAMATYYATGILMISGSSLYSSKTAALLWFALGSLFSGLTRRHASLDYGRFIALSRTAAWGNRAPSGG